MSGSLGIARLAEGAGYAYGWLAAVLAMLFAAALTVAARRRLKPRAAAGRQPPPVQRVRQLT